MVKGGGARSGTIGAVIYECVLDVNVNVGPNGIGNRRKITVSSSDVYVYFSCLVKSGWQRSKRGSHWTNTFD